MVIDAYSVEGYSVCTRVQNTIGKGVFYHSKQFTELRVSSLLCSTNLYEVLFI